MENLFNYLTSENTPILHGNVSINMNDAAIDDPWAIPSLITGGLGAFKTGKALTGMAPYFNDIWQGRKLLFHKPFGWMSKQEFKNYGNLGKNYYKNFLQKNPVNIKGYGKVEFGKHNRGKDLTQNMEQYPFLRKNLETGTLEPFSTNYKNETDRIYDYFSNTYKGDLYHYLIENISKNGKRYKMMKNKTIE